MTTDTQKAPDPLMTSRMIYGALIAGVVMFTAVALVLNAGQGGGSPGPTPGGGATGNTGAGGGTTTVSVGGLDLLVVLAIGYTAAAVVPSFLIRGIMLRKAELGDGTRDPHRVMTGILLQGAMLEGGALFGTVAYFVTGQPAALIATALGVGVMLGTFPKRRDFEGDTTRGTERTFGADV